MELTAEEIAAHYAACGDSVALINAGKPADVSDDDWADTLARNKEHLVLMLAKDYWTTESMTAMTAAAA
jgi:hypothetical protein|tara:strand:+ start:260 stop:466 length:207 start_codon:yes stop_codon:yes gene_type:complete